MIDYVNGCERLCEGLWKHFVHGNQILSTPKFFQDTKFFMTKNFRSHTFFLDLKFFGHQVFFNLKFLGHNSCFLKIGPKFFWTSHFWSQNILDLLNCYLTQLEHTFKIFYDMNYGFLIPPLTPSDLVQNKLSLPLPSQLWPIWPAFVGLP